LQTPAALTGNGTGRETTMVLRIPNPDSADRTRFAIEVR